MKPALSVIFFTVMSGAGLGALFWLALATLAHPLPAEVRLILLGIGLAFTVVGLISSTLHLANPKNAWRAFSRVRSSWLSREGVLSLLLFPIAGLFVLYPGTVASLLLAAASLAVLLCTGMIYACLKTVPRWHTPLTPAAYVTLGLYSGSLVTLATVAQIGTAAPMLARMTMGLLALALVVKMAYYLKFAAPQAHHTVDQALPLSPERKTIRLLDLGHTHGNFLTEEFFFVVARKQARRLRMAALLLAFVLPALVLASGQQSARALTFATLCCLAGLLAERWLFFAEAQHVVRLYHGASKV